MFHQTQAGTVLTLASTSSYPAAQYICSMFWHCPFLPRQTDEKSLLLVVPYNVGTDGY